MPGSGARPNPPQPPLAWPRSGSVLDRDISLSRHRRRDGRRSIKNKRFALPDFRRKTAPNHGATLPRARRTRRRKRRAPDGTSPTHIGGEGGKDIGCSRSESRRRDALPHVSSFFRKAFEKCSTIGGPRRSFVGDSPPESHPFPLSGMTWTFWMSSSSPICLEARTFLLLREILWV